MSPSSGEDWALARPRSPLLGDIGIGQLIARIDRDWDTRDEIRQKIAERLPVLKTRAKRTNELLVELLRKSSPE